MEQRRGISVVLIGVIGVTFLALFRAPEKKRIQRDRPPDLMEGRLQG